MISTNKSIRYLLLISIFFTIARCDPVHIKYSPEHLRSFRWTVPPNYNFENINKLAPDILLKKTSETKVKGTHNKTRRDKRAGKAKIKMIFANTHGLASFLRASNIINLTKNSVCFLSETWVTKHKYTNVFDEKFCMVYHADKNKRGRPFGGLQLIVNPKLNPQPISESKHHLAIELRGISIIGCYFDPTCEVDTIIIFPQLNKI